MTEALPEGYIDAPAEWPADTVVYALKAERFKKAVMGYGPFSVPLDSGEYYDIPAGATVFIEEAG